MTIGGGFLLPTMLMTAVACIILGMGLPSIPAYIIVSTMAAGSRPACCPSPGGALVRVLLRTLRQHHAAGGAGGVSGRRIVGGSPMRTGFLAMRLALGGLIVPFVFDLSAGAAHARGHDLGHCSGDSHPARRNLSHCCGSGGVAPHPTAGLAAGSLGDWRDRTRHSQPSLRPRRCRPGGRGLGHNDGNGQEAGQLAWREI